MSSGNRIHARAGFSLIEVLIAVLVLAIGMLGLGAVFPAIIAEQRESFAAIEGQNAAAAAEALLSNPEMVDFRYLGDSFNKAVDDPDSPYEYVWAVQDYGPSSYTWPTQIPNYNFDTGLWNYDWDSNFNNVEITDASEQYLSALPLSSRLYPQPYSGKEPKLVWDVALRREPGGDRFQAAIFVRRIDARIRVPRDHSLSDVLTGNGGINANEVRLPVVINRDTGLPAADDGAANKSYAVIQMLKVEVYEEHLDWLVFTDGRDMNVDTSVDLATQIGQQLVDNTGTVRTVIGTPQVDSTDPLANLLSTKRVVLVDPPFQPSNAGGADTRDVYPGVNDGDEFDSKRASWVRQVIFTPREPIAVRVVTLEGGS